MSKAILLQPDLSIESFNLTRFNPAEESAFTYTPRAGLFTGQSTTSFVVPAGKSWYVDSLIPGKDADLDNNNIGLLTASDGYSVELVFDNSWYAPLNDYAYMPRAGVSITKNNIIYPVSGYIQEGTVIDLITGYTIYANSTNLYSGIAFNSLQVFELDNN